MTPEQIAALRAALTTILQEELNASGDLSREITQAVERILAHVQHADE